MYNMVASNNFSAYIGVTKYSIIMVVYFLFVVNLHPVWGFQNGKRYRYHARVSMDENTPPPGLPPPPKKKYHCFIKGYVLFSPFKIIKLYSYRKVDN